MVAWCCFVLIPITGLALFGAWLGLYLSGPEDGGEEIQGLLIAGATLLGLCFLNLFAYLVVKSRAGTVKNGEGFPESRSTFWSVLLLTYAGIFTVCVAWPLGWLLQTIVVLAITPFVSEKTRLNVSEILCRGLFIWTYSGVYILERNNTLCGYRLQDLYRFLRRSLSGKARVPVDSSNC